MNVLVTGGCGFVGFNLCRFLKENGFGVVAMDNLVRKGVEISKEIIEKEGIDFVHGDVRCAEDLNNVTKKIDLILNTAADPSAVEGYANPYFDVNNNFNSVINVLEFARKRKIGMIQWSTNKVYSGDRVNAIPVREMETRLEFDDKNYEHGINEDFTIDGREHSIYGVTKAASDIFCQEYSHAFDFPVIVNRFSCLGGEWQWGVPKQGWFSWWPIAFTYKKPLTYIGWNGKQVRDVLYIDDLNELILKQIKQLDNFRGDVFNVGGGKKFTISLIEATKYLEKKFGYKADVKIEPQTRRSDHRVYYSDIRKASSTFNWKPKVSPEEALDRISAWARTNKSLLDRIYLK